MGLRIAHALSEAFPGRSIVLLDLAPPLEQALPPRARVVHGDVSQSADVRRALHPRSGVRVVVHVASWGMSGASMLDVDKVRAVNVVRASPRLFFPPRR